MDSWARGQRLTRAIVAMEVHACARARARACMAREQRAECGQGQPWTRRRMAVEGVRDDDAAAGRGKAAPTKGLYYFPQKEAMTRYTYCTYLYIRLIHPSIHPSVHTYKYLRTYTSPAPRHTKRGPSPAQLRPANCTCSLSAPHQTLDAGTQPLSLLR
ncbi:hypothetical protein CC78DRAFT_263210 [Lojkania enalia]|uniref:Uncharacterized protein n=1 Tax=Lojkania enalia TaxID=147567 RepID=A0A9P4MZN0_9PLEO|nr:hypothetical protein CC78DRAFT_263210 [Didymosphaeria enalia]